MTIKPLQADFMNYSYFFKNNYRKGVHRFESMLSNETQFQLFVDSPAALIAAFGPDDVQTPALCDMVCGFGEPKRVQIANAFAKAVGYDSGDALLADEGSPVWQRKIVFSMTTDRDTFELTSDNLKKSLLYGVPFHNWVGQTINLGNILVGTSKPSTYDGSVTIVGVLHDDKSDGSGKAMYTVATQDGRILRRGGNTYYTRAMNNSADNIDGWQECKARDILNSQFHLADSEFNSHVVAVDKITHNLGGTNDDKSSVSSTSDKFWTFSLYEMFGTTVDVVNSADYMYKEGKPYQHLVDGTKTRIFNSAMRYWLRTVMNDSSTSFYCVSVNGELDSVFANESSIGHVVGFCLD